MKSAGHQLESWQQESALAIVKRLLVASMACVTVWAIAADNSQNAAELRALLIKLSGRQMKRTQPLPRFIGWPVGIVSHVGNHGRLLPRTIGQPQKDCPTICVDTFA